MGLAVAQVVFKEPGLDFGLLIGGEFVPKGVAAEFLMGEGNGVMEWWSASGMKRRRNACAIGSGEGLPVSMDTV